MKTLYLWGACALLSTTLFSCTADEFETAETKPKINPENFKADPGPDDDPVPVTPPNKP